jgi:small-conductance mechanosensitive channel
LGIVASVFTTNAKKWRDVAKQLELPAALFFWFLGVEVSFLPTMKNHHITPPHHTREWEETFNKIIISGFVWTIVNLVEKFIIQLIAMSFHMRTYADRIEINKFQIGSLAKLYAFSTTKITDRDEDFEVKNDSGGSGGMRTPLKYAKQAQKSAKGAMNKVGDVAGTVAADFAGRQAKNSTHPHSVVLTLLRTTSGSQVLARRLYRTFVRDGFDTVFASDLKEAFDNDEEAEAAFAMFDKDLNGDISMEELESVCMEVGRDRKSITASLKDLDSVVGRLDGVLSFFVFVIVLLVFLSLISTSAAGVLTSAGSTILALSWLFSATGQEFLQSVVFVFIKHPFDVGDRVRIYGFTGDNGLGDDYYVKQIALLYTEFKKMQGHVVQAPNSYLNTLFILNVRRSGSLAEVVPIVVKFGTTLDQIDLLRLRLLEFVRSEKREYQTNILTEMREVTENYSISINVVFFYKTNIQNELLRLIRRNKFVCMLSIALQELGIEGPRVNLPGANVNFPFNLHSTGQSQAPLAPPSGDDGPAPATRVSGDSGDLAEDSGATSSARHPSILRKGSDAAAMRARGAATSRKHVDFSSTVREMTGEDMVGDVFEDRDNTSGVSAIVRESNREAAMRRIQEREEEEERRSQSSPAPGRSSNLTVPEREGRRSGESHSMRSISSSIHRNRFFRHRSSVSREREDVEKGK